MSSDPTNFDNGPWHTLGSVIEVWPEAEGMDPRLLQVIIDAARKQCEDYLPAQVLAALDNDSTNSNIYLAHLMQIQALWKSAAAGPGDTIGPDGLTVTVFPMDRTVKRLLRPSRGVPVFG